MQVYSKIVNTQTIVDQFLNLNAFNPSTLIFAVTNEFSLDSNPDFWVAKLTAKPQNIIRASIFKP